MEETRFFNLYNPINPLLIKSTKIQDSSKDISPAQVLTLKHYDFLREQNVYETQNATFSYMSKLTRVVNQLYSFIKLDDNWDGYGASPISPVVVKNTFDVIINNLHVVPTISPTGSNSIVLIFAKDDSELIIEVFDKKFGFAIIKNDLSAYDEFSDLTFDSNSVLYQVRKYYGLQTFYYK